jgi:hypothetical protein
MKAMRSESEFTFNVAAEEVDAYLLRGIDQMKDADIPPSRGEIEALLRLDRLVGRGEDWVDLLARTVADFVVWVERPTGHVTAAQVEWLVAALNGPDGALAPSAGAIVAQVVREAEAVDPSLLVFALSLPARLRPAVDLGLVRIQGHA